MSSELSVHFAAARDAILGNLPDEPLVSRAELAALRADLTDRLRSMTGSLPGGVEVHLDRHVLPSALVCPASSERKPFEWTAPFAARSIGIVALNSMLQAPRPDAVAAARNAIQERIQEGKSLGEWLRVLDAPAEAAVLAAATTWTSRAWVAVPWRALGTVRFAYEPIWHRPLGRNSAVVLRGRPDAAILIRGPKAQERVLLSLGWPDSTVTGLGALVAAMDARRTPLRAVTVHPSSGRIEAPDVDLVVLRRAVDDVVAAVEALAPVAAGGTAAEIPGRQCWYCDRREVCVTGTEWANRQPRRVAGVPVS